MTIYSDEEFESLLTSALLKAAQENNCNLPSDEELDEIVIPSNKYIRRMNELIKDPMGYVRKLRRPLYLKVLRTVAVVVLVISVMLGAVMLNPISRAWMISGITSWLNNHTVR